MTLAELIKSIKLKHPKDGFKLNPPATKEEFQKAESKLKIQLPADFREFYSKCNGFERKEDNFAFLSLKDLFLDSDFGKNCVVFADYNAYSDVWVLRLIGEDNYEIFYNDGEETVLTHSLSVFLENVLKDHVKGKSGLFAWRNEIKNKPGL